jgi:hypothetical protein
MISNEYKQYHGSDGGQFQNFLSIRLTSSNQHYDEKMAPVPGADPEP